MATENETLKESQTGRQGLVSARLMVLVEHFRLNSTALTAAYSVLSLVIATNSVLRHQIEIMTGQLGRAKTFFETAREHRPETRKGTEPHYRPKTPATSADLVSTHAGTIREAYDDLIQLKSDYEELQAASQEGLLDLSTTLAQTLCALEDLEIATQRQTEGKEEYRRKYREEMTKRRLLYNELQELRGNIRVFVRVRKDPKVTDHSPVNVSSNCEVILRSKAGKEKLFAFDYAAGPSVGQETIFENVQPLITSAVDGYNVCIMAYGQTGAGKTHTMTGPPDDPGVIRRAVQELFRLCSERTEVTSQLEISIVEIYNENICDLLADVTPNSCSLISDGTGPVLKDVTKRPINSPEDAVEAMALGSQNRSIASTKV